MSSKITIIGAGSVGSTIAYTLAHDEIASEIVLIDINKEKVEGEVMDIEQGTCFRSPVSLVAGDYADAKDSDIVIITSGIARKPGQTRIELTQTNVNILKSITPQIVKEAPNAKYIIVSNPVDIMTYVFTKISGLPENQIIGSGTILDSARLRCGLSEHLNVAQNNIHAYVFGEHGDTSFIPWTGAYVSGVSLDEYYNIAKSMGKEVKEVDKDAMLEYVQKSGGQIIKRKGATFYAVSASVCKLCSILSASSDSITTVSSMMHGEYGIEDVCLSTLTLVGPNGIQGKVPMRMNKNEIEQLHKSADALKAAITPKTKLLIMPFPNNPTGAVMEREDLEAVAEVLRGTNIMVLSDEIYAELNYGLRPHVSIATLPGMAERTIVVNGFSKTYAMTGWRLGYACGPAPIIKIHQSAIMSAPTTSQYAAITALKECDGEIDRMRDEYNMRRRLVVKSFNDMGLTCFEPRGAFYAFPCIKSTGMSSQDFCTKLLEQKHVAIIPGDAFGASGEGYARISYAYSVEHLKEALRRIREFLQENGIYHGI